MNCHDEHDRGMSFPDRIWPEIDVRGRILRATARCRHHPGGARAARRGRCHRARRLL